MTDNVIRLLSLNIGNPSLDRAKKQCEWLMERTEDIFVLTETKNSQGCEYIEDYFMQYGYDLFSIGTDSVSYDVCFPKSITNDLGVMIISKYPIKNNANLFNEDSIFFSRQLECEIELGEKLFCVTGLYVPSRDRSEAKIDRKKAFVEKTEQYLHQLNRKTTLIMGDLNILERSHIPHYSTFFEWEYDFYDMFLKEGFYDAYKLCHPGKQEYSWVGRSNDGYRYDYCFVSEDLKSLVRQCDYIHETRKIKITDHSAISVEIQL